MNKTVIPVPDDIDLSGSGERQSFRVSAAADTTVIELFDDMFPWEAKRLLGEIRANKSRSLEMRINSPGGDVFGGVAVYNALARFNGTVNVEVEGVAASIASIIAMAGDRIRMGKGAFLMIHEPHAVVMGGAGDMQQTAALLLKIRDSMADIYAERTGQERKKILQMMADETWMTADEAVELGFADGTNGQARLAAHIEPGRFVNVPKQLLTSTETTPEIGPDAIKAVIAGIADEKILRGLASNIGNRIKQLGTPADAAAPEAKTEADPPEAPPAAAADVPKAETPAAPIASPLEKEAAQELIDRVLGREKTATA